MGLPSADPGGVTVARFAHGPHAAVLTLDPPLRLRRCTQQFHRHLRYWWSHLQPSH